jgi:DDE family transposase
MEVLETLLGSVRRSCSMLPDKRTGANRQYTMADIGLAAFAVFFAQSPSFLAHQRHLAEGQGRSNCETLFGMNRIPTDNHIRALLDPVAPKHLFPVFGETIAALERSGGVAAFRRLGGHVLIALDGTEYHRSSKVQCRHCATRTRSGQPTEYFHTVLCATLVAPGHDRVVPLEPEFITPQDGHAKQDCESRAARRWLARHGAAYARLKPVYLGDDLYARQPLCEAVRDSGGHFLFVCKPSSHQTIQEYLTGVEISEHVERVKRGRERVTYRYRWLCDVPLRGDDQALSVNWLSVEIVNAKGKVTYRNSFITDLPVNATNVAELSACGRARWKIENESFNVLKTKGYHLEHNFGHGQEHLASVLVTLNLLAFAIHTVCDLAAGAWRQARDTLGPRTRFFHNLQALTAYLVFPSWTELLETLAFARAPPRPPG